MATYDYKSTQVTAAEETNQPKYNARDVGRMVKVAIIDYVMLGTESATETVELFTAPKDAQVLKATIVSDGIATTATLDIGVDGGAADSIVDGADVAAAGTDSADCLVAADGKQIYATFATLATPVADKTLKIAVEYAHNT